MEPLYVLISYSWDDSAAAELLHEELALRGMAVSHDRCSFTTGTRLPNAMSDAVGNCDGYVAYFTPSSLYENRPAGSPRPVIDEEFLPIMDRLAANAPGNGPVVAVLTHGLGGPRREAPERIRRATGRDVSSLWTPIALDQTTTGLTQPEAAAVAASLLEALLSRRNAVGDRLELAVTTRGTGQPAGPLAVDATSLVGGAVPRPGDADTWARFVAGLGDLERCLARSTSERRIHIHAKTHLSAAITLGRTFHQAAGWDPIVAGRYGDTRLPQGVPGHIQGMRLQTDRGALGDDISVEIDLLGMGVTALAAAALARSPQRVSTRVVAIRDQHHDMQPSDIADAAKAVAAAVRAAAFDRRPKAIHLFCAAPVEFAVLLGHQLTSLHAPLQLHERDTTDYVLVSVLG